MKKDNEKKFNEIACSKNILKITGHNIFMLGGLLCK
jgi:hypothetical protein